MNVVNDRLFNPLYGLNEHFAHLRLLKTPFVTMDNMFRVNKTGAHIWGGDPEGGAPKTW